MSDARLDAFDSVYFLMWPGWRTELRSNRWHWARRWARVKPLVLVQPDRLLGVPGVRRETRFDDAEILSVAAANAAFGPLEAATARTQQIERHMKKAGHSRPLLWIYNPYLLPPAAALPASARVLHATENYFDFEAGRQIPGLVPLFRTAARIADVVIAVSPGVAEGVRREAPAARVAVVTNGCDYGEYSSAPPSHRLVRAAAGFDRVAIYAGNVNYRVDLALLRRCAERWPRTLFAVFGPVAGLDEGQPREWTALVALPNVRHFGPAPADELPSLYAASQVGLIPYRRIAMVERNGFPLKALEMAATGLPVVSTYMAPLEAVAGALSLERDEEGFVRRVGERDRRAMSSEETDRVRAVARAHDYDRKFEDMLSSVLPALHPPTTALDAVLREGWVEEWARARDEGGPSLRWYARRGRRYVLPRALEPIGRALPSAAVRALGRFGLGRRVLSATGRRAG